MYQNIDFQVSLDSDAEPLHGFATVCMDCDCGGDPHPHIETVHFEEQLDLTQEELTMLEDYATEAVYNELERD